MGQEFNCTMKKHLLRFMLKKSMMVSQITARQVVEKRLLWFTLWNPLMNIQSNLSTTG